MSQSSPTKNADINLQLYLESSQISSQKSKRLGLIYAARVLILFVWVLCQFDFGHARQRPCAVLGLSDWLVQLQCVRASVRACR
jgi:hypothetical protein